MKIGMNRTGRATGVDIAVGVTLLLAVGAWAQTGARQAPKTIANLKAAYVGETTACSRYLTFANVADKEGHPDAARLFRAAASAEAIHARNHKAALEPLGVKEPAAGSYTATPGTTRANLKEAVRGESYERDTMYPRMLRDARTEGQPGAVRTLSYAKAAEAQHAALYAAALRSLPKAGASGAAGAVRRYSVCPVCGATFAGNAPGKCPECGTPAANFESVE